MSTLIKMLSINNLVIDNKKLLKNKQCKSLLTLLVQYLRGKFEQKVLKNDLSDTNSQSQEKK